MKKKNKNDMHQKDTNNSPENREAENMGNQAAANNAEVFDNVPEADEENQTAEDIENQEMSEIDALAKQLAEEKLKVEKEKKEYLFLMAEFDNFRKRTLRERTDLIKTAAEKALKGILPIVDDFERGLDAIKDSTDAQVVKEGMELIYNKFVKYLADNGVKAIESTGSDFDTELHEAVAMVPAENDGEKGKVKDTVLKGYMINDKVLRHAKVVVAQ